MALSVLLPGGLARAWLPWPAQFRQWANGHAFWRTGLLAGAVSGLLLALLGPFGTYLNGGAPARAVYWIVSSWLGIALYGAAATAARRGAPVPGWRRRALLVIAVLLASLPQTMLTRWLAFLIWPRLHAFDPGWLAWFGQAALLGLIATFALDAWRGRPSQNTVALTVPASKAAPVRLRGDVLALQMEDHYVRVHTGAGSALEHMTMSEAVAGLENADGLRVHRSWWVARRAVTRVEGTPRAMRLMLSNGVSAPVSRAAVARLRAEGWLAAQGRQTAGEMPLIGAAERSPGA